MDIAEQPHRAAGIGHIIPAVAFAGALAQNFAQRQAGGIAAQPGQLFGQFGTVRAKGVFAVKGRGTIGTQHGSCVGTGGIILQNGNVLVDLNELGHIGFVLQAEILVEECAAVPRVHLGQQVQVVFLPGFPVGDRLRCTVQGGAQMFRQKRCRKHNRQRQQEPGDHQPTGGIAQTEGARHAKAGHIHALDAEQHVEHFHQAKAAASAAAGNDCLPQHRVRSKVGPPHENCIEQQPPQVDAAQILEGIDETPAEHKAVQLDGIIENAAHGQAAPLEQIPQQHHQHQGGGQQQRKNQIIPRCAQNRSAAQPGQPEPAEQQRHHPHIQKAIHDDSGKSKACSGFHFAASQSGAQKIAHMEWQQKVDGVAPGHGAQQAAALGVFINADKLFPPEQAEHMPQQHQCRGGKQQ